MGSNLRFNTNEKGLIESGNHPIRNWSKNRKMPSLKLNYSSRQGAFSEAHNRKAWTEGYFRTKQLKFHTRLCPGIGRLGITGLPGHLSDGRPPPGLPWPPLDPGRGPLAWPLALA